MWSTCVPARTARMGLALLALRLQSEGSGIGRSPSRFRSDGDGPRRRDTVRFRASTATRSASSSEETSHFDWRASTVAQKKRARSRPVGLVCTPLLQARHSSPLGGLGVGSRQLGPATNSPRAYHGHGLSGPAVSWAGGSHVGNRANNLMSGPAVSWLLRSTSAPPLDWQRKIAQQHSKGRFKYEMK